MFAKETIDVNVVEEMESSYLDYAMSVIVGRALPDVRDGLKPVHRRSLFAMNELGNTWNRAYKKSARIVGDVIGKYHPHGDAAVYESIVRLAQDFSMRYTLVDGQGNFGSIDGDGAAAMRYTEVRMARITQELLYDLDKETVNFGPNYDGSESEPLVLPNRFPNLLVNGSSGIAVGMATNIPPHNLTQTINGAIAVLEDPEISVDELIKEHIPAPDFPTGGIIYGISGVVKGYQTGRGRVVIRAKTHIEECGRKGDREAIIVDEIPYQVNKAKLCEKIGELVRAKVIEGIQELRDESDKSGLRIVIELKKNEIPDVVLNKLFKLTQMQFTFGINMVALVDGQPKLLNLKDVLFQFIRHRREVVTRRTIYLLKQAKARGHILEGLAVASSNIDEMIKVIKESMTPAIAKERLQERAWDSSLVLSMLRKSEIDPEDMRPENIPPGFGYKDDGYHLTEVQAQAIVDMRLARLTGLEQEKITQEYEEILKEIMNLLDILARKERLEAIIKEELVAVKEQYGDERKTSIDYTGGGDILDEDLITPQDLVVTMSHFGYIKSQPQADYQAQRRGGRGKLATQTRDEDFIEYLFTANTHDTLLCFTDRGRCFSVKVYELPQGARNSKGRPLNNIIRLDEEEKVTSILPVTEFTEDMFIVMATANGVIKKVKLDSFARVRPNGIIAITLDADDTLIGTGITRGSHEIILFASNGKATRINEDEVRVMGRNARGVRGMRLKDDDKLIDMISYDPEVDGDKFILTATEHGYGKLTAPGEHPLRHRGSQGVIAINTDERNGKLVAAILVSIQDDIMMITSGGVLIRTKVAQINITSRYAKGVKLINPGEGEVLVSLDRLAEADEETNTDEAIPEADPDAKEIVDDSSEDEEIIDDDDDGADTPDDDEDEDDSDE